MTMEKSEKILERLKEIECPFTWELETINDVILNHIESRTHDDENYVPLLKWMRTLVYIYECILKKNLSEAKDSLKEAEEIWDSVKAKHAKNVSINVLENIYKGTKCYVALEDNKLEEIEEILKTVNKDVDYKENLIDRSTLNGCKSVAWSYYKDAGKAGINTTLDLVNLAIKDNPECDIWHFISGKNLRRFRRLENFANSPTHKELSEFTKAYELSKEPTFGIYLAQFYKEKRDNRQALKVYREIYNSKPESANTHLRLALGFTRLKDLQLAKKCLDYAEQKVPDDSMFLHYKGIYLETIGNSTDAADYFLKASKGHNYGADMSYLKCKAKIDVKFDFVEHLQNMLKTYSTYENRELDITLQLAACYYMYNHDIPNAAKYYLHAFEKYPKDKMFEIHICILGGKTNIYNFILSDFLKSAFSIELDRETKEMCEKLKDICEKNCRAKREKVEFNFNKLKIR